MKFHNMLADILGNKHKIKIVKTMLKYTVPESPKEFHIRELARLLKEHHTTIARNLLALVDENLIKVRYAGTANLFRMNAEHPFFRSLVEIFQREEQLLPELKNHIKGALSPEDSVLQVVLFGSLSRGQEKPTSDIDLFIIVKNNADLTKVEDIIDKLNFDLLKMYGNAIMPMIKKLNELKELKTKAIYNNLKSGMVIIDKGVQW